MKIKPCPFCSISQVEAHLLENAEMKEQYTVSCGACGCQCGSFKTKEEAIKKWNKRKQRLGSNCPLCNQNAPLESFKLTPNGTTIYYQYKCTCGFQSGISRNSDLIISTWNKNS